jgi:hypothetical protein
MQHRAFISYVRENTDKIDRLCRQLTESGASVWLDRTDIAPGVRWKDAIRREIRNGAFFVACFSKESTEKRRSYMNEELSLAVDELRLRPMEQVWFIPVILNDCEIPGRTIGGGQQLSDIHYLDLSIDWEGGVKQLLEVIAPLDDRLKSLYAAAGQALSQMIRKSKNVIKSGEFTIGFTGNFGCGISALLRQMEGFSERVDRMDRSPVVLDGIEVHRIDGVGRVMDIRTSNTELFHTCLNEEVDVLVFVIGADSRVHERDIEAILNVSNDLPCLVVISKWDLANEIRDSRLCKTVEQQTGRPVVIYSREHEFKRSWLLMNNILVDLATNYSRRKNRFWHLFD